MNPRLERIQKKIAENQPVVGVFVLMADSSVSEIVGYSGCDFVWIDSEHGMLDRREIYQHIMAAQSAGCCAFVRVPGVNEHQIKHILDMGPDGVIFPFINTAALAREVVSTCTYPKDGGRRGIGPLRAIHYGIDSEPDYLKVAKDEVWRILQIESMEAVQNIDAIIAVDGYQSLFIGPADLNMSMLDVPPAERAEKINQITVDICEKASKKGIYVGSCAGPTKASVGALMGRGCHWMTIAQDVRILSGMLTEAIKDIHG